MCNGVTHAHFRKTHVLWKRQCKECGDFYILQSQKPDVHTCDSHITGANLSTDVLYTNDLLSQNALNCTIYIEKLLLFCFF